MMEMEVAVEKNPRARTRAFAFSPAQSHEVDDDYSAASGDGGPDRGGGSGPSGLALKHKLPQMLKIAVIGDSTCGKTVICEAFCRNNFTPSTKYSMTCGVQIYGKCITSSSLGSNPDGPEGGPTRTDTVKPDEKLNLVILDSTGSDLYRDYLPKYWEKLEAVILVIDLTSASALESSRSWIELAQASLTSPFSAQGKKVGVLIGNKTDLREQRQISHEEAQAFANEHNLEYMECSVRNNTGFEEPFHFLAREWFDLGQARPNRGSSSLFRGQGTDKDGDRDGDRDARRQ